MAESMKERAEKALDLFNEARDAGTIGKQSDKPGEGDFPGDFEQLKLSVIRPAFEDIASRMTAIGYEISISEEPGGKIAIHIVPPGVNKSIHPYDWFPTLSFFGAPFTKTVGVHGRNMRPNGDNGSGARGDYKPEQLDKAVVEKELTKFIGEIGNW
jgi:hypothetical protein